MHLLHDGYIPWMVFSKKITAPAAVLERGISRTNFASRRASHGRRRFGEITCRAMKKTAPGLVGPGLYFGHEI